MTGLGRCMALLLCLALGAPAGAAQFSFAVFGDVPYNAAEDLLILGMIAEMNGEPLAFAMHVGDFKSSRSECSDALFVKRLEWFGSSRHPFVFIPGDNDWTDCARASRAPREPLERLAKLRELFFAGDTTLGERRLPVERQRDRGYPEHMRWMMDGVVFATLNVPGPANNATLPQESRPRTEALLDWMRDAFRIARERKLAAVVIALHANLWAGNSAFRQLLLVLAEEARRYSGEVLVVHGDTHWHRFDQPLLDLRSGKRIPNVTRLEVFGSPFVNWVQVTVTVEQGKARFEAKPVGEMAASPR